MAGATGLAVVLTLTAPAGNAWADRVYPSAGEVARAQQAVQSKARLVHGIEQRLQESHEQLARVQARAEQASEAFNGARAELDARTRAARKAEQKAKRAAAQARTASRDVARFAANAYKQGGSLGSLEAFLSDAGPQAVLDRAASLSVVGGIRDRSLEDASATARVAQALQRQADLARAQKEAAAVRAEHSKDEATQAAESAAAATERIESEQQSMIADLAQLRQTSVAKERARQEGLRAEAERRRQEAIRRRILQQQRERAAARQAAREQAAAERAAQRRAEREAAERAARERAAEQAAAAAEAPPAPPAPPPPPAPAGGVDAVIAFARAQVGEAYVWGAAGPGSWDCSGLTMMAWKQAGVYLGHYTGLQWSQTTHVPVSQAQPGDLIFYSNNGSVSGIYHVGLYIGGGQMIEAANPSVGVQGPASIYRPGLMPSAGRVG
ncbi:MAG TPA: NlpC/P60 family protein [Segeticoccus sp.]|nr:NlpC/P60 family protein [Segeticoccus sp.]